MITLGPRGQQWLRIPALVLMIVSIAAGIVLIVSGSLSVGMAGYRFDLESLCIVAGLLIISAGVLIFGVIFYRTGAVDYQRKVQEGFSDVVRQLAENREMLRQINRHVMLSDAAKALAFRETEHDAFREAIRDDIAQENWDGAHTLIDEMERRFGARAEAQRFRQMIEQAKAASREEKISAALERIEQLCKVQRWQTAQRETRRLMQIFPDDERVAALPQLIARYRQQHKRRLLSEWDEAVKAKDIDRSIELLKQLDQYLTPSEAAALTEPARGVFRAKLHNLGVQFSIAVTEKQWDAALNIGEQIMNAFPNSRMAQEVRERIDILRERARNLTASKR